VRTRAFWPFGVTDTLTEHTPTFLPCTLVPLALQKRAPAFATDTFTFDDFGALIPAKRTIALDVTFLPTFTDNIRRTVAGDVAAGTVTAEPSEVDVTLVEPVVVVVDTELFDVVVVGATVCTDTEPEADPEPEPDVVRGEPTND
jgi:hypothetical protein